VGEAFRFGGGGTRVGDDVAHPVASTGRGNLVQRGSLLVVVVLLQHRRREILALLGLIAGIILRNEKALARPASDAAQVVVELVGDNRDRLGVNFSEQQPARNMHVEAGLPGASATAFGALRRFGRNAASRGTAGWFKIAPFAARFGQRQPRTPSRARLVVD